MQHIFNFFIVVMLSALFFTGCSTHEQPQKETTPEPVKEKMSPITMYIIKDVPSFNQGESVTVLSIDGPLAMTQKGAIALSYLEKERSTFRLTVRSSDSATVRILSIKPKYTKGIWLSPGDYHIEVSEPGYKTYRKWIVLDSDKELHIKLKKTVVAANGTLTWQKMTNIFSENGLIWQNRDDKAEKMTWQAAKDYCNKLEITTYGYRVHNFTLPRDTELLQLLKAPSASESRNAIYWSSTIDENQDSYAKYVNVNSGENSWYKKHGKTYVMCRQDVHYPKQLSLTQLASSLKDKKALREFSLTPIDEGQSSNQHALNALQMAIFLKYGNPMIQNANYDEEKGVLVFELISQHQNTKGEPLYRKEVTLSVEKRDAAAMQSKIMDPNFEPIVEFKVTDGKLSFIGI